MIRSPRWTSLAAVAAAAALAAGASAAQAAKIDVRLSLAEAVVQGDRDVAVDVTVTNTTGHAVDVLKWQLPGGHALQGPLFRIVGEDGRAVPYVGPLVKRAAPRAEDYLRLEAGESRTFRAELTGAYQLGNGHYTIEYVARGRHGDAETLASSAPVHLWTSGRQLMDGGYGGSVFEQWMAQGPSTQAASITYTGNCTSSQKTTLSSAVTAATNYANSSYSYLSRTPSATQRYVKWFGAFSTTGWNTAKTHFANEVTAFTTKPLTLDCSCKDSGTYAYVYPNQPYKIYVCGAFWSAPMTGTDSKGGTLVHEMSHFYVVASTDDWAYGQSAAAKLAINNPTKALDNADSHEYFAENNPYLP